MFWNASHHPEQNWNSNPRDVGHEAASMATTIAAALKLAPKFQRPGGASALLGQPVDEGGEKGTKHGHQDGCSVQGRGQSALVVAVRTSKVAAIGCSSEARIIHSI